MAGQSSSVDSSAERHPAPAPPVHGWQVTTRAAPPLCDSRGQHLCPRLGASRSEVVSHRLATAAPLPRPAASATAHPQTSHAAQGAAATSTAWLRQEQAEEGSRARMPRPCSLFPRLRLPLGAIAPPPERPWRPSHPCAPPRGLSGCASPRPPGPSCAAPRRDQEGARAVPIPRAGGPRALRPGRAVAASAAACHRCGSPPFSPRPVRSPRHLRRRRGGGGPRGSPRVIEGTRPRPLRPTPAARPARSAAGLPAALARHRRAHGRRSSAGGDASP